MPDNSEERLQEDARMLIGQEKQEIRFAKQFQWGVAVSTLLLLGAIVGAWNLLPDNEVTERWFRLFVGLVLLTGVAGAYVQIQVQGSISRYREILGRRVPGGNGEWSGLFKYVSPQIRELYHDLGPSSGLKGAIYCLLIFVHILAAILALVTLALLG